METVYDLAFEAVRRIVLDRLSRGDDDFTRKEWLQIEGAAMAANRDGLDLLQQAKEAITRGLVDI